MKGTICKGAGEKAGWRFGGGNERSPRKPFSNPRGWEDGTTTEEDLAERPHRLVVINGEQEARFHENIVKTTKYEAYSFVPKFLWEEFNPATKIANVYFLFIAGLQVIKEITNTFGIPLMLIPLLFVVCVDGVFMIIEDVARRMADKFANSSKTLIWDKEKLRFRISPWSQVSVGDFIMVRNRDPIPCDILFMGVDEPSADNPTGICYVETRSLDGETNLKIRQVIRGALGRIHRPEDCQFLRGRVVMEHPDKLINSFKGKLILDYRPCPNHRVAEGKSVGRGTPVATPVPGLAGPTQARDVSVTMMEEGETLPQKVGKGGGEPGASPGTDGGKDVQGKTLQGSTSEVIGPESLLLRGCVLRNTRWAIGLVLNTGPDTKIMMSMTQAPSKSSHLTQRINEEIKRVAAVMVGICIVGAALGLVWNFEYLKNKAYLMWEDEVDQPAAVFFIQGFYYALLLNSFIPISLYVSMNFVRFFQAWFMNQDLDMYHADGDTPARVRTMNLNEDLGQVSHVFSDKTGTLTCNIMDFRKFSVGGTPYGMGMTEIGRAAMAVEGLEVPEAMLVAEEKAKLHAAPHVNFYDPTVYKDMRGEGVMGEAQAKRMEAFFLALALCHTVIPEKFEDSKEVMLSASSPDDEALVLGAKYFGYEFVDRVDSCAVVKTWPVEAPSDPRDSDEDEDGPEPPQEEREMEQTYSKYEVLHILGFSSDRKRMSVIVRMPDGKIRIICKGADTVMIPRLRTDTPGAEECIATTVKHMDTYAAEGLRTLVVAQADLEQEEYESWADKYEEATTDLLELEKQSNGEANRIDVIMSDIERNLEVLGSSAIEDKLQTGVPGTVADLMLAGIKIWVLTGDKEETAINIAVACQLLWTESRMDRIIINLRDNIKCTADIQAVLEDALGQSINEHDKFDADTTGEALPPKPRALIIDGPALLEAMRTPASQGALLRFAQACHSVVGCRVSPDQKRAMVALVRENVPGARTLSIGDGANDVPMIQGAHIGVGISGQEGMQAVNASDYAIGQFCFLRKLLLVHGRWNYRRSSRVVCYLFYKSIIFACPLLFYAYYNGFSGTLFYDYVTTNLYAVAYTALPILLFGIYDRDIQADTCLRFPELYSYGIEDGWMRPGIFWSWMLQALLEGAFITVVPLYLLTGDKNQLGTVTTLYEYGTTTFALVVLTVSCKMFWVQNRWTLLHASVLVGSVACYYLSAWILNTWMQLNWDYYKVLEALCRSAPFWGVSVWCLVAVIIRDLAWKFHHRWWSPRLHHLVMESECNAATSASANLKSAITSADDRGAVIASNALLEDSVDIKNMAEYLEATLGKSLGSDRDLGSLSNTMSSGGTSRLQRKRGSVTTSVDPRETNMLMRNTSFFINIGDQDSHASPHGHPSPLMSGGLASFGFVNASPDFSSRNTTAFAGSDMDQTGRGGSAVMGPGVETVRRASVPWSSPGGYAFSCDNTAQKAEIEMIMGQRTRTMGRSKTFYKQRNSIRALRMRKQSFVRSSSLSANDRWSEKDRADPDRHTHSVSGSALELLELIEEEKASDMRRRLSNGSATQGAETSPRDDRGKSAN